MKIERISENQIRCTLTSFDLSVRNLNLGELAYGSEKARNLFREMIQKASNEVGFDAEDIPLMVEAIPLSNESVMLVITKIEDPEELDTRFAKFTPFSDDDMDSSLSNLASELLEGAEGLFQLLNSKTEEEKTTDDADNQEAREEQEEQEEAASANAVRIYQFDSLDRVCEAAHAVGQVYKGSNTLYKKPNTHTFYLVAQKNPGTKLEFSRICNILSEYGSKIKYDYASEAYYLEHYETMVRENALQSLSQL